MARDDLTQRYQQAIFRAMATAAERQPAPDPQTEDEPEAPTLAQMAQIMGIRPCNDIGPGMTETDRLRRWAGLK